MIKKMMEQSITAQPRTFQWMLYKKQLRVMGTLHQTTYQHPWVNLVPLDQRDLDIVCLDTRYSTPFLHAPYREDLYLTDRAPENPPTGGGYLAMQDLFNVYADKIIIRATEFETYPDFDDAPVQIPEPDPWYKVALKVTVGVVAVAVTVVVGDIAWIVSSIQGAFALSCAAPSSPPLQMLVQPSWGAFTGAVMIDESCKRNNQEDICAWKRWG